MSVDRTDVTHWSRWYSSVKLHANRSDLLWPLTLFWPWMTDCSDLALTFVTFDFAQFDFGRLIWPSVKLYWPLDKCNDLHLTLLIWPGLLQWFVFRLVHWHWWLELGWQKDYLDRKKSCTSYPQMYYPQNWWRRSTGGEPADSTLPGITAVERK